MNATLPERAKPAGSTADGHAQFFPRPRVKNEIYYANDIINPPIKNQL